MTIGVRHELARGDTLLICTDGFWGPWSDAEIGAVFAPGSDLAAALEAFARRSVEVVSPGSDNTTAAAIRWLG
jgi:serine/threonine protein phosphatase PrpC